MKTYTVLYAEDVPHYGTHEMEAVDDAEAIHKAKAIADDELGNIATDPDHHSTVCKRIVHIETPTGEYIGSDIPLDDFHLRHGGEPVRILCDAAPLLADALDKAYILLTRIRDVCEYEGGLPVTFLEARDIEIIHGDAVTELPAIRDALIAAGRAP